jgi:hypothetical protein
MPFTLRFVGVALCAAWALAGCGTQSVAPAPPQHAASARADTASQDLLYVSDVNTDDVYALRYPRGGLVFTLTGFGQPDGLCSDAEGNVFVTNYLYDNAVEYAHGARTPTKTFIAPGATSACSVDPTTGNLAVVFSSYSKGTGVAVFPSAQGSPVVTYSGAGAILTHGGYDNEGNLFLDGDTNGRAWGFFVLPKSGGPILYVTLSGGSFSKSGQIQWDGKHMAVLDESLDTVSRIKFHRPRGARNHWSGTVLGVTTLKECGAGLQSWIQGSAIIVPCSAHNVAHVKVFDYPAGGHPIKTVGRSILLIPAAVTVSVAH